MAVQRIILGDVVGPAGVSPDAKVTQADNKITIAITDAEGSTQAELILANDLITDTPGKVLDARQGKRLYDLIEELIDSKLDRTGIAMSAAKLELAQEIITQLDSNTAKAFDGSAGITPGVTGVLSLQNGGLGIAANTIEDVRAILGLKSGATLEIQRKLLPVSVAPNAIGNVVWNYSVPFSGTPVVSATISTGTPANRTAGITGNTATGATIHLSNLTSYEGTLNVHCIAVF